MAEVRAGEASRQLPRVTGAAVRGDSALASMYMRRSVSGECLPAPGTRPRRARRAAAGAWRHRACCFGPPRPPAAQAGLTAPAAARPSPARSGPTSPELPSAPIQRGVAMLAAQPVASQRLLQLQDNGSAHSLHAGLLTGRRRRGGGARALSTVSWTRGAGQGTPCVTPRHGRRPQVRSLWRCGGCGSSAAMGWRRAGGCRLRCTCGLDAFRRRRCAHLGAGVGRGARTPHEASEGRCFA
jgi:hypothetical protein